MITEAKIAVMMVFTRINSVTNISRIIINSLNLHEYAFVVFYVEAFKLILYETIYCIADGDVAVRGDRL